MIYPPFMTQARFTKKELIIYEITIEEAKKNLLELIKMALPTF